jgi:Nucleotidyl transferase AbiEii toxin, Type IV TA system
MPVSGLHAHVATLALRAAAEHGFALGGGNALIAHGIISRPTHDVDLFTNQEHGVEAATGGVETALHQAGYTTDRIDLTAGLADIFEGIGEGLAEWIVTAPAGQRMALQMAYFDRIHEPVIMEIGPVLDLEDAAGGKVAALASRIEPRDYADTAAMLSHYSVSELISFAKRLDPGLTDHDFAAAGRQLDQIDDDAFTRYGLTPADTARLRQRMAAWPREATPQPSRAHQAQETETSPGRRGGHYPAGATTRTEAENEPEAGG